jgi:hypothetical protein
MRATMIHSGVPTSSTSPPQTFGLRRSQVIAIVGWASAVGAVASLYLAFQLRGAPEAASPWGKYALLGFWAFVPPVWFFVEYVYWPPAAGHEDDRAKHLHDLARNIWLALIVVLATIMDVPWPF